MIILDSIDRTALPLELLPLFKSHLRITWTDEDAYLNFKLAAAIDLFTRLTGFSVFASEWSWRPSFAPIDETTPIIQAEIPVMRVSKWTATSGPADTDVTANYQLVSLDDNPDSISLQFFAPFGSSVDEDLAVSLTTGYATQADMSPSLIDTILRLAAYLYEWREIQNVPGVDGPAYANALLAGWWRPRC